MAVELPPALSIIGEERLWNIESVDELKRKLRSSGLLRELRRQASWTLSHHRYQLPPAGGFTVVPAGSLDPFVPFGKCGATGCRIEAADRFVKTVALYADSVVVPDPLTAYLAFPAANLDFKDLFQRLAIYRHVLPLVRDGVVRFALSSHHYCAECVREVVPRIAEATERVIDDASERCEVNLVQKGGRVALVIRVPIVSADLRHPLVGFYPLSEVEASKLRELNIGTASESRERVLGLLRPRLMSDLTAEAANIVSDAEIANHAHGVLIGSSRLEMLCLADIEGSRPSLASVEDWEDLHSVDLPWVHELTPGECLIVRKEASTALPKLRALLKARLARRGAERSDSGVADVLAELRAQVSEVEAEIGYLEQLGESRYKFAVTGLALSIVLYGLASGAPAVTTSGLAALLAGLAHVQSGAREVSKRRRDIITAPAFLLAKARDVLRRRGTDQSPNLALHRPLPSPRKRRR